MRSFKEKIKYGLLYELVKFLSSLYFFKPYACDKDKLSCEPFFILGSGRNGSTLLASTLSQYQNIHIPPEQFVLPYAIMKFRLFNFFSWERLTKIIWNDYKKEESTTNWKFYHENFKDSESLKGILDKVYSSSTNKKFKIWGDKTPQNTYFIKHIFPVYPNAKYLFIVRDGRDVVNSLVKMMHTNKKYQSYSEHQLFQRATELWNKSINVYDWLQKKGANLLLVKYEDFTSNPDKTINEIASFLNVELGNLQETEKDKSMGVQNMSHHQNLSKPITTSSIGKWKKELSQEQISSIQSSIEENLNRFKYF